jgi:hypothetical protein
MIEAAGGRWKLDVLDVNNAKIELHRRHTRAQLLRRTVWMRVLAYLREIDNAARRSLPHPFFEYVFPKSFFILLISFFTLWFGMHKLNYLVNQN